ncbi:hypothetical protein EDD11_005820 [Mortierella claussenii]|nr:hypothetical protein EDD11_005820 [Mortierella claussenii]
MEPKDITAAASLGAHAGRDVLIRRFRSSLVDQFKDIVEKVWWQPYCENHDIPLNATWDSISATGAVPESNSLGVSCAFAVGRTIAQLPDNDSNTMERYYSVMPAYMRRTFQLDLAWSYKVALRIGSADAWIDIVSRTSPDSLFTKSNFQSFIHTIQPQHRATLIPFCLDAHMGKSLSTISDVVRRSRLVHWTMLLIEDSLRLHDRSTEACGEVRREVVVNKCNDVIEQMARYLFETNAKFDRYNRCIDSHFKGAAIALTLHSLYIAVTKSADAIMERRAQEWTCLLEAQISSNIKLADFDVVIKSYGTLPNLNALVVMLDAVGLYAMSMKLINRMLNEFGSLRKHTVKQLGYPSEVTISSLETHLQEVKMRWAQYEESNRWEYDDMLGDWVERSPRANKAKFFDLKDEEEESGEESKEEECYIGALQTECSDDSNDETFSVPPSRSTVNRGPFISPSTPPRSRPGEDISIQSHLGRRQQYQDAVISPFVLGPIRYSMTPSRRPVRSSRRQVCYNDSGSDLDLEDSLDDGTGANIGTGLPYLSDEDRESISATETDGTSQSHCSRDSDFRSPNVSDSDGFSLNQQEEEENGPVLESTIDESTSNGTADVIVLSDSSYDGNSPQESILGQSEVKLDDSSDDGCADWVRYMEPRGGKATGSEDEHSEYEEPCRRKTSKQTRSMRVERARPQQNFDYNRRHSPTIRPDFQSHILRSSDRGGNNSACRVLRPRMPAASKPSVVNVGSLAKDPISDDDHGPPRSLRNSTKERPNLRRLVQRRTGAFSLPLYQDQHASRTSSQQSKRAIRRPSVVVIELESDGDYSSQPEQSSDDSDYCASTRLVSGLDVHSKRHYHQQTPSLSVSDLESSNSISMLRKRSRRQMFKSLPKRRRPMSVVNDQRHGSCSSTDLSTAGRVVYDLSGSESADEPCTPQPVQETEESSIEESFLEDGDGTDAKVDLGKEARIFRVGAPLPPTEPDELAFWM